jgi:hypothetical protein
MPDRIPAMTVTIQVRDGPTVHLDYNPALEPALPLAVRRSLFRPYVACTSMVIANQQSAPPQSFADVVTWATALLFAYSAYAEDWPADLRATHPAESNGVAASGEERQP